MRLGLSTGISSGGLLEGYRYAFLNEFTCYFIPSQILGASCSFGWRIFDIAPVLTFLERFGTMFDQVVFLQADPPGVSNRLTYGERIEVTFLNNVQAVDFDAQQVPLGFGRPTNHWLVHDIPEPSTLMLFGISPLVLLPKSRRSGGSPPGST